MKKGFKKKRAVMAVLLTVVVLPFCVLASPSVTIIRCLGDHFQSSSPLRIIPGLRGPSPSPGLSFSLKKSPYADVLP